MLRIGNGYDVHRLVEGRRLMLGGVEVPHTKGVLGHSDGDVLLHAITDAIIGALGLGDIGLHFPDNDENLKDIDSAILLKKIRREWLNLVSGKRASTSSTIEKRIHYLKINRSLCYNRLYLKNFKEK